MAIPDEEYDKLSKEERDARDKEDRAREKAEQAGMHPFDGELLVSTVNAPLPQHCPTPGPKNWGR